ncbi:MULTISPECIES: hypothetical protein [unclassified Pseudomonas]|uniref:hypothetical protein n=1 Tax=unclassified Pseudomonas TaxID=196821 RepID=UPI0008392DD4|nr:MULTISPECIES: hypothetical protein [unclassified Pseudomonas]QIH06535.1 hypothetical protein ATY02_07380 [Pseudomonas sp. BIOMIG1BAC]
MNYATFHPDGTLHLRLIKGMHQIPKDAVEVDDALWQRLIRENDGIWSIDADGKITKQLFSSIPLTRADIERLRLAAYAEPIVGSDRYFAEANRMQVMGEAGWEAVRSTGIARFNEIQARFPWAEDASST